MAIKKIEMREKGVGDYADVLYPKTSIDMVEGLQSQLDGKLASGANAVSATKLATARTISLGGDATGSTTFDGTGNATITVTVADDSHNHVIDNVDGLQTALDGKAPTSHNHLWSHITDKPTTFTPTAHNHSATEITSGVLADARLSGTYSGISVKVDGSNTLYTTPSSGSSNTSARTIYGLAEYRSAVSSQVGAIVFIQPNTTNTIMAQFEIAFMLYAQNIGHVTLQGYRTTGAWSGTKKISKGTVDVQTRFGVTPDGKNCIILGDVGTTWSYPHISIIRAMLSHTGASDAVATGWTTAVVTDLTGYTNVTANITDEAMIGNITGNSATATKLATARTISLAGDATGSVTFDGSANASITVAVVDDSHNHIIANVDGLQSALDAKESITGAQAKADTAQTNAQNYALNLPSVNVVDTRAVNSPPSYYRTGGRMWFEFKNLSTLGISATGTYCTVMTDGRYPDSSGGQVTQTVYTDTNRTFTRTSTSETAWGAWTELATTATVTGSANGLMLSTDKTKIDGIATGATNTVNNATNGAITVNGVQQMVYTHPTGAGNNHIPTGGASGNFLKYSASGTAVWSGIAGTDVTQATTAVRGTVQLSDAVNSTSTTLAGTANAVKKAYDLANNALPKSGGTVSGDVLVGGYLEVSGDFYANGESVFYGDIIVNSGAFPLQLNGIGIDGRQHKIKKSGKDSNGIFTVVELHHHSYQQLVMRSTLSGGTSPQYTTRTIQYYGTGGSLVETKTFTLSYDSDGELINEN